MRTQAVCRLHRELVILIPGGAHRRLSATRARAAASLPGAAAQVATLATRKAKDYGVPVESLAAG